MTGLGKYHPLVEETLAQVEADRFRERLWQRDHTLWHPDPTEISNRLDWLDIAGEMLSGNVLKDVDEFVSGVRAAGLNKTLLLGMGGSSLCPEVLSKVFGTRPGFLGLEVLDSTHPAVVADKAARFRPEETLFIVSSKSGTTVEPLSFFKYFYGSTVKAVGATAAGGHFCAITDQGSHLARQAGEFGFRRAFYNNPNIGGRYSALSHFGMVPAALLGLDVKKLLSRAAAAARAAQAGQDRRGYLLGAAMGRLALAGRDKLTLVLPEKIAPLADWVEQLVAESLGKIGRGVLPVAGEPLSTPESYGPDRFFVHLRLAGDGAQDQALAALAQAGHPVLSLDLADEHDLGAMFIIWEVATALAGRILGVLPFVQPDVESAKVLARQMLAEYQATGALPAQTEVFKDRDMSLYGSSFSAGEAGLLAELGDSAWRQALEALLRKARPGAYLALQAYLPARPEITQILDRLRPSLRERFGLAVTIGFGPRFLHSTGQLHKGDAGNGLFVQFTDDGIPDLPIPDEVGGEKSSVSFGALLMAQALGDGAALDRAGRPVLRVHLGPDAAGNLNRLAGYWS